MTKRELIQWLENKKQMTIRNMENEAQKQEQDLLEGVLKPAGFYEMADQVQELIHKAWGLWKDWKADHETDELRFSAYSYCSFEYHLKPLVQIEEPLSEYIAKYNIELKSDEAEKLKKEAKQTTSKISQAYNRVINAVYASKSAKEAKAYVESLGFDLSELENPPAPDGKVEKIDTSYLFLKQAA